MENINTAFIWHDQVNGGSHTNYGPFHVWLLPTKAKAKGLTRYTADITVPKSRFAIRYTAARAFECYAPNITEAKMLIEKQLRSAYPCVKGYTQVHYTVTPESLKAAEQVLVDNGIDADEADTVLQALGYALLDTELYPESLGDDEGSV